MNDEATATTEAEAADAATEVGRETPTQAQEWYCTKCKKKGKVRVSPSVDVMSTYLAIVGEHRQFSPDCTPDGLEFSFGGKEQDYKKQASLLALRRGITLVQTGLCVISEMDAKGKTAQLSRSDGHHHVWRDALRVLVSRFEKPAHEVLLRMIEDECSQSTDATDTADALVVKAFCRVLQNMVIPDKERPRVIAELGRIRDATSPIPKQRSAITTLKKSLEEKQALFIEDQPSSDEAPTTAPIETT